MLRLLNSIGNPKDYGAHAIFEWIASNAMFEKWPDAEKEGNSLYQILKPFLNPCDRALGRIASELDTCPSSSFHGEHLAYNCGIIASMLTR